MKKLFKFTTVIVILMTINVFSSCKKDDDTQTIYEELGGTSLVNDPANPGTQIEKGRLGLRSVVDSTIFVIAGDPTLNGFFVTLLAEVGTGNTTNFAKLSKNLTDFFAVATGAENYTYTGLNMKDAHDPAKNSRMNGKASNADMDHFIADVVIGAQQNNVPSNIITEIGKVLETVRTDVVQK